MTTVDSHALTILNVFALALGDKKMTEISDYLYMLNISFDMLNVSSYVVTISSMC